jgi:hypothetical protein
MGRKVTGLRTSVYGGWIAIFDLPDFRTGSPAFASHTANWTLFIPKRFKRVMGITVPKNTGELWYPKGIAGPTDLSTTHTFNAI